MWHFRFILLRRIPRSLLRGTLFTEQLETMQAIASYQHAEPFPLRE